MTEHGTVPISPERAARLRDAHTYEPAEEGVEWDAPVTYPARCVDCDEVWPCEEVQVLDRLTALEAALADCSTALSQALAAPLRTDVRMAADKNEWATALVRANALLATRAGAAAGEE